MKNLSKNDWIDEGKGQKEELHKTTVRIITLYQREHRSWKLKDLTTRRKYHIAMTLVLAHKGEYSRTHL